MAHAAIAVYHPHLLIAGLRLDDNRLGSPTAKIATQNSEENMSECLHCDINDLVQKHLERSDADLADLVGRMAESIADLILVAPEIDQANLMATAIASLGQAYLEKTGAIDSGESNARH
jgi:hypothetical protein